MTLGCKFCFLNNSISDKITVIGSHTLKSYLIFKSNDLLLLMGMLGNFFTSTVNGLFLKFVSTIFYQIFIFSQNDSTLKTMKNVFYFI